MEPVWAKASSKNPLKLMIKLMGKTQKLRRVYLKPKFILHFLNVAQMAQIDEKQEAIAKIRMAIDHDFAARAKIEADAEVDSEEDLLPNHARSIWAAPDSVDGHSPHWKFGSPENPINSRALETEMSVLGAASFKEFDEHLRDFLSSCLPGEAVQYEDPILVSVRVPQ
jgi:hypothetical protein